MIKIQTVKKGAELVSIKMNDIEKMHDGESFWNRHSPVLFPIVGKLKDGKTTIMGNEYFMGQHGFARDMEFEEIGEHQYVLKANDETLSKFPFRFELYISYEVEGNKVITKYKVVNKDDKLYVVDFKGNNLVDDSISVSLVYNDNPSIGGVHGYNAYESDGNITIEVNKSEDDGYSTTKYVYVRKDKRIVKE